MAPRNDRAQLSLFAVGVDPDAAPEPPPPDPLRELLATIDPDTLSPRDAHDLLYKLVERA